MNDRVKESFEAADLGDEGSDNEMMMTTTTTTTTHKLPFMPNASLLFSKAVGQIVLSLVLNEDLVTCSVGYYTVYRMVSGNKISWIGC